MNEVTTQRPERFAAAFGMFVLLLLSYVVNAMDRQVFPLLAPDVRQHYGFSLAESGLLSTVFTLGIGVAGIPTGMLMARYRRKTFIIVGILIFSLATLLTAYAASFWDLLAYRLASGIGEAMQLTALLAIATAYFRRHRGAAIGAVNLCFALGAIIGPRWGGQLLTDHDWRMPLIIFGVVGFAFIVAIVAFVRPWFSESTAGAEYEGLQVDEHTLGRSVRTILLNRNTIALTVATAASGMLLYGYVGMYPSFLREELGFSGATTGSVMSIFGFGAILSIFGGWAGDRVRPRRLLGICFAAALLLGVLMFNGPATPAIQAALSFGWGAVISSILYVNLASNHARALPEHLAGWASGVFVTSLYVPAAFCGYLVGWLTERSSWEIAGSSVFSGFAIIGIIAVSCLTLRTSAEDEARQRRGEVQTISTEL